MSGLRRSRLRARAVTLIEVMVSVGILAGTLLAVLLSVTESVDTMSESFNRRAARTLARQKLEEATANPDMPDSGVFEDQALVGFTWSAVREEVPINEEIERTMTRLTVVVTFPVDGADASEGGGPTDQVQLTTFVRSLAAATAQPQ